MGTQKRETTMTEVSFREMAAGDIAAVAAMEKECFAAPWPFKAFEEELENRLAYYLLAVSGDVVIGYAGMWVIYDEAHITNVAVTPARRGQGVGRSMMLEAIRFAGEKGASSMTLEVRPSNAAALALYEKLGFVRAGVRRQYYEDTREDALIMWLNDMKNVV